MQFTFQICSWGYYTVRTEPWKQNNHINKQSRILEKFYVTFLFHFGKAFFDIFLHTAVPNRTVFPKADPGCRKKFMWIRARIWTASMDRFSLQFIQSGYGNFIFYFSGIKSNTNFWMWWRYSIIPVHFVGGVVGQYETSGFVIANTAFVLHLINYKKTVYLLHTGTLPRTGIQKSSLLTM